MQLSAPDIQARINALLTERERKVYRGRPEPIYKENWIREQIAARERVVRRTLGTASDARGFNARTARDVLALLLLCGAEIPDVDEEFLETVAERFRALPGDEWESSGLRAGFKTASLQNGLDAHQTLAAWVADEGRDWIRTVQAVVEGKYEAVAAAKAVPELTDEQRAILADPQAGLTDEQRRVLAQHAANPDPVEALGAEDRALLEEARKQKAESDKAGRKGPGKK